MENKFKIAVVDDEFNLRLNVKTMLTKNDYDVVTFSNGKDAWDYVQKNKVDMFVLDIMMPLMDGLELCQLIKNRFPDIPVMFLTSKDEEFDRIQGLELGADDYLCKPFSLKELAARIKVILNRYYKAFSKMQPTNEITFGSIKMDLIHFKAFCNENPLTLTVSEFRILECMIKNPEVVFSREQLLEKSYPNDAYQSDRAIDCHIKRLRKKLSQFCKCDYIETVYGLGYKIVSPENN